MTIKYSLFKNPLTKRPNDCYAHVCRTVNTDKEAIIDRMLKHGTLLTRTDILAVLNHFEETVTELLAEGRSITYPLFNMSFSISGVFSGLDDSFDAKRHKFNITVSKGVLIRDAEKQVKLEKINVHSQHACILQVKDSISETINDKLTAGGIIEVSGFNLKIEGNAPACGLWFIDDSGEKRKADVIIYNKPEKVIATIPDLKSGNYQVKIVTQYKQNGKLLKTPKEYIFKRTLWMEDKL